MSEIALVHADAIESFKTDTVPALKLHQFTYMYNNLSASCKKKAPGLSLKLNLPSIFSLIQNTYNMLSVTDITRPNIHSNFASSLC